MNINKSLVVALMLSTLAACGGGGSESKQAQPAPVLKVSLSIQDLDLQDGGEIEIPITIENTTGDNVALSQASPKNMNGSMSTEGNSVDVSLRFNRITIKTQELRSSNEVENLTLALEFKAGELKQEIPINIVLHNDELAEFYKKRDTLYASRYYSNPFSEITALTTRYLLQAEILGLVHITEYAAHLKKSPQIQSQYEELALDSTQAISDAWLDFTPTSDEEAMNAAEQIQKALNTYRDLYQDYLLASRLPELMEMDLGLPKILIPVGMLNPQTKRVTGLTIGSYGDWVETSTGPKFQYNEDYKFLERLDSNFYCQA